MEALVNSLDTAALSREQLEAELTKLRSENDQLRTAPMDTDDPVHPCRKGGPRTNGSWWSADHAAALEQLRQAESGEAPLGGTARKHLGLS